MSWSYRPSLDGLRTLAMYLIVLFHASVPWAEGTFIAVNLFFVLSGYLVTNVILTEMDKTGTLRLGDFYARRVRRLLPAAVVAIVGISLLFLLIFPVVRRLTVVGDAQASLLYVANWRFIQQASDYFATDVDKSPFLHFWTLAIEEQFYLVFPLVLLLLGKHTKRWVMFASLAGILLLSLGSQLYWARVDELHAYFGTDARLYQLMAGVLLAIGFRYWPVRLTPRVSSVTATAGMAGFLVLSFGFANMSESVRGIWGTLACTLLIAGLMQAEDQPLGRLLSRRTPVYLGKISYATYLWHWPAILVLQELLNVRPIVLAVIAAVIATSVAAASNELLEMPIRKSKALDRFRWRTVAVGVTTSVLVAVTVVPAVLGSDRRPALAAASATEGPTQTPVPALTDEDEEKQAGRATMPENVDWKKIDRERGTEYGCDEGGPEECIVVEGDGPHILVVGDSHARMMSGMFSKLAEEQDFTLSMNTVSGCPWQENLENLQSPPPRRERCAQARVGWYDRVLPKLAPDLVVIMGLPRDEGKWEKRIRQRDGRKDPLDQAVLRSTKETLRKIDRVTPRVLLVESLLMPEFEPNDCLTSRAESTDCAFPVLTKTRPTDGFYLAAAAESPTVRTVDLNPAFCPTIPICHPVDRGQIVWRDKEHLTPGFAVKQRKKVWRLIEKTGVLEAVVNS